MESVSAKNRYNNEVRLNEHNKEVWYNGINTICSFFGVGISKNLWWWYIMSSINVYYSDLRDGIVNEKRLFDLIELDIVKIEVKTNFVKLEGAESWLTQGLYTGSAL